MAIIQLLSSPCFAAEGAAQPNVIFLLADDLGWGDLSCHGSPFCRTPNIDQLAKEGTDFHQFYTTSPVCSPSRAGFMTGKFPARFGIHSAIGGVRKNADVPQVDWLDPKADTLPRLLKGAGYATGHVGKWHLQSGQADDAPPPSAYGVDEVALFAGTAHPNAQKTITHDQIWDAAVDFLKRHRAEPFYLNVWMHETHLAHMPSADSLKVHAALDERQRIYAAVATDADRGVGKILAALKELGLDKNTIVVFSSDNGPENTHASMKEMRGGYGGYYSVGETGGKKGRKRSLHDGGVSTPFIVRWPGKVPAGRVDKATALSATDLLPTVCAAVGVKLPATFAGDGENMLTVWQGKSVARSKPIFWDWNGTDRPPTNWPRWAVRDGDWKLVTDGAKRTELYRLSEDRAEANNVASKHPEVVARLRANLDDWKASLPKAPPDEFISKKRRNAKAAASNK
ncbi:MAG: sulfatase-like hydrolase/transferase [Verrucomicrobiota bacterium]